MPQAIVVPRKRVNQRPSLVQQQNFRETKSSATQTDPAASKVSKGTMVNMDKVRNFFCYLDFKKILLFRKETINV